MNKTARNVFTDTAEICHQNHNRHNSQYLKSCTQIQSLSCPTDVLKVAKLFKKKNTFPVICQSECRMMR